MPSFYSFSVILLKIYLMTLFEQLLRKREFVIFGIPTGGKFYIIFYKEKRIRELPFPSVYILKFFLYFAQ